MEPQLKLCAGQASLAGRKPQNQDSIGIRLPEGEVLDIKGAAAVIADGVSASESAKEAAEACVTGFLNDYYSTPDSWSVERAAEKVLGALNRWLHGEGERRHGSDSGMVCTISALILKSNTAYSFHVGDSRLYLLRNGALECLTRDHHTRISADRHVLARAMGVAVNVEIDFRRVTLEAGDIFLLTTDGVHEYVSRPRLEALAQQTDAEAAAWAIVQEALDQGSDDNVSAQVLRIEQLPTDDPNAHYRRLSELPFPPPLEPDQRLDGYRIVRELHASKRTQVYLAVHEESGERVVIKTPSPSFQDDPAYIDRFLNEEWAARRVNSPHVLHFREPPARRQFLYCVTEYVDGPTLREWMYDHPAPALEQVRAIVQQLARGLRALHRLEMVHQDLKPENIVIDADDTVKIIDLGAVRIRGIEQIALPWSREGYLGTESYAAPECLEGLPATPRSDRYALGVIAYEMLTGRLPYRRPPTLWSRRALHYRSAREFNPDIPAWMDGCLEKAVALNPDKRYDALSEFLQDLNRPNPALVPSETAPLIERLSLSSWKLIAGLSLLANLVLLLLLAR